jgi:kynureninase
VSERARALDAADPLARFRGEFVVGDPDLLYLDGNSLGRLPRRAIARLGRLIEAEWGERLIRGWGEGWMEAPRRLGTKVARLLGVGADDVLVADSTSVNLFKLVVAALRARPERRTVVTDALMFPSDLYVIQGALDLLGGDRRLVVVPSADGLTVPTGALAAAVDRDTALVALCHTAFKSSFVYDLDEVTALAHRSGAWMLWDVCHSVGAMPLALAAAEADLAVGCGYKYLNGGPGAPAFLYVRPELQDRLRNPIQGWLGHGAPFDFDSAYVPAPGIQRFLAGTPPVLSLAALEPGLDLLLEAGLDRIRAKSVALTELLIAGWEAELAPLGYALSSPRGSARRGSHVSLGHAEGWRINRALLEELRLIGDFRAPDNIRLGVAPLYTTFAEVDEAVARLARAVRDRLYEKYPAERPTIT